MSFATGALASKGGIDPNTGHDWPDPESQSYWPGESTPPTIEVRTVYRDVVIGTRYLGGGSSGPDTHRLGGILLLAGIGIVAVALGAFLITAFDVGAETAELQRWQATGRDTRTFAWKHRSAAGDFAVFGGLAAGLALTAMGLYRRGRTKRDFIIGSDADADAPVAPELLGAASHPLLAATENGYVVNVTSGMTGELCAGDRLLGTLPQLVRQHGTSLALPADGRARLECGGTTFFVAATAPARRLPVPWLSWRWAQARYTLGAAIGFAVLLLMIFTIPPDPRSLSLDLLNGDPHFVKFLIKPSEEPQPIPAWVKADASRDQSAKGSQGKQHADPAGKMGKTTSTNRVGSYAIKGPRDNPDPHLARNLAEDAAKNAGILGILRRSEGSHIASIFGRDSALGRDASDVLGNLVGSQIAEAGGNGGLGQLGTGAGGGDTGKGTIGVWELGKIGTRGDGPGHGPGGSTGVGALRSREQKAVPDFMRGVGSVRGSLDKEIVRRIIRRHLNEVKYCYEQGLAQNRQLAGRVVVQFTIAGAGQVIASVLQSSTMGNVKVESCTVQAVRRWEFPKPLNGGLVIVSYPFLLTPAGSE